jgi:peroxiredoxin
MKRIFFLTAIMAMGFAAMHAQTNYNISAKLSSDVNSKAYLYDLAKGTKIDSASTTKGEFTIKGSVKEPMYAILIVNDGKYQRPVWLDASPLQFNDTSCIEGSEVNKRLFNALNQCETSNKVGDMSVIVKSVLDANRTNVIPVLFLAYFNSSLDINYVDEYLKTYTAYNNNPLMIRAKQQIAALHKASIGSKASDITLKDVNGKPHKLSSYFGRGYVLLDFWASWCGPCRGEMPNVKKAFETYSAKGFKIVGISLDNKLDAWKGAIKTLGITWTQLSDLKGWQSAAADLYGVQAIPATFLIDPKGKIVARNLRGEELIKKLSELYK